MQTLEAPQKSSEFLNFIATKKKAYKDWAFLHIKAETDDVDIKEIIQFLEHQFQGDDSAALFDLSSKGELFLAAEDTNRRLAHINQKIFQTFSSDRVLAVTNIFNEKGLEQFVKLISPHIPGEDISAQVSLKRVARMGNAMMVLDDDAMVIKQMEHILGGLGHVATLQDHTKFLEEYRQYAPDILFLDIHLRDGASGPGLMDDLLSKVDPYAHVIIISSDTAVDTIQSIKTKGVKGFVVKPFDRNKLFKYVMSSPTFMPRAS